MKLEKFQDNNMELMRQATLIKYKEEGVLPVIENEDEQNKENLRTPAPSREECECPVCASDDEANVEYEFKVLHSFKQMLMH